MIRTVLKSAGRTALEATPKIAPLGARKAAVKVLNTLPGRQKEAVILALLHDWASADPAEYHRFIWANHLSYAQYYDFRGIGASRGAYFDRMHPHRVELLEMVVSQLRQKGIATTDATSFLDVGCSLGYLLRYIETTACPTGGRLLGIDIDTRAVTEGAAYLAAAGSSVNLRVADVDGLGDVVGDDCFDVVTCTGVLHYLEEEEATHAVGIMLKHASTLLALSGPPFADADNATLISPQVRPYDHTFIHNFDRMITENGGQVVARSWRGRGVVEGKSGAYLVVAAPADVTTPPR